MKLPESVQRAVERDFAGREREEAAALLSSYGGEPHHRETDRVLLDILRLAAGDIAQVRELVERAKRDFRDIILWAEHPAESRLDTPGKRAGFNSMLERFGAEWRIPENDD